jgi:uncharacterized protein
MADDRSEPSMEAILSSIKKIIAEDDRASPPAVRRSTRASVRDVADPDETAMVDDDILELTESAEDEDLLDTNKAERLAQSFSVLKTLAEPGVAPQIVRSGETSLEGLVRELMRPMLKEWLDSNLPTIVDAMVSREIERITKKG